MKILMTGGAGLVVVLDNLEPQVYKARRSIKKSIRENEERDNYKL